MHEDTRQLLADCTAGIDMALNTLDGMLPNAKDKVLRQKLQDSIRSHRQLRQQTTAMLHRAGGREKAPSLMAKSMAWVKINTRMALKPDDTTVAYLVADGCDMGVKSVCRSRNRYPAADADAKLLAEQLIDCDETLSASMRPFL